jgi:hypothetical protein
MYLSCIKVFFLVASEERRATGGRHYNPSVKMVVLKNLAVGLERFKSMPFFALSASTFKFF